jgi:hypothetical protein
MYFMNSSFCSNSIFNFSSSVRFYWSPYGFMSWTALDPGGGGIPNPGGGGMLGGGGSPIPGGGGIPIPGGGKTGGMPIPGGGGKPAPGGKGGGRPI